MEPYSCLSVVRLEFGDFESERNVTPSSQSFFLSVGIGMVEIMVRLKDTAFAIESWQALESELTNAAIASNEKEILLVLFSRIREPEPNIGLQYSEYYFSRNEANCLEFLSNFISYLIDPAVPRVRYIPTSEHLNTLSAKLKLSITVICNDALLQSANSVPLPAVYIKKSSDSYSILYYKQFFQELPPEIGFPLVNKFIINPVSDAKILINAVLDVCADIEIPADYTAKLCEFYSSYSRDSEIARKILRVIERNKGVPEFNTNWKNGMKTEGKCKVCDKQVLDVYPGKLKCQGHRICIDCIVNAYKQGMSSCCRECGREYGDEELGFIESLY